MLWCGEGPRILPYLGFYQAPLWSQKSSKCPLFETFRPPLYRRMAGSSTGMQARCTCDRRLSSPSPVSWTWKLSAKNGKLSRVCSSSLSAELPTCPVQCPREGCRRCPASVAHMISSVGMTGRLV